MRIYIGPQSLSCGGTHKSSRAILWVPVSTQKLSRFGINNFYKDSVGIALVTLQGLSGERCRLPLTVQQMSSVSFHSFQGILGLIPKL
jgi:hypothetical protein